MIRVDALTPRDRRRVTQCLMILLVTSSTTDPAGGGARTSCTCRQNPRAVYEGGLGPPFPGTDVRSSHRPAMEGLEKWRRHNGCAATARTIETRAGRSGTTAQTATLLEWDGCAGGARVAHWKLTGVGHLWPGAPSRGRDAISGTPTTLISAAEEIWRFVSRVTGQP